MIIIIFFSFLVVSLVCTWHSFPNKFCFIHAFRKKKKKHNAHTHKTNSLI